MYYKSMMLIATVICSTILGCQKSELKVEEKMAQNLLTSANLEERHKGTSVLLKLQVRGFDLSKKTAGLLIKTLDNEIQTKKSFEEKEKSRGKNINQIIEEFNKQYPHGEYTNYLENLTSLIANSRVLEGIPIVFQFLLSGGYVFDDEILTNFGAPAFDFLMDRVTYGAVDERELAMSLLALWINPPQDSDHIDAESVTPLSEKQKLKLKPIFLKGFQDPNLEIKYYTIRGLGAFQDDPEIKKKLSELTTKGETEEIRSQAKRILKEGKSQ